MAIRIIKPYRRREEAREEERRRQGIAATPGVTHIKSASTARPSITDAERAQDQATETRLTYGGNQSPYALPVDMERPVLDQMKLHEQIRTTGRGGLPSGAGGGQSLRDAGYGPEGAEAARHLSGAIQRSVESLKGKRGEIDRARDAVRRASERNKKRRIEIREAQKLLYQRDESGQFLSRRQRQVARQRIATGLDELDENVAATAKGEVDVAASEQEFVGLEKQLVSNIRNAPQMLGALVEQRRFKAEEQKAKEIKGLSGAIGSEIKRLQATQAKGKKPIVFVGDEPFEYKKDWDDLETLEREAVEEAGYTEETYKKLGSGKKPLGEGSYLVNIKADESTTIKIRQLSKRREELLGPEQVQFTPWEKLPFDVRRHLEKRGITPSKYKALYEKENQK